VPPDVLIGRIVRIFAGVIRHNVAAGKNKELPDAISRVLVMTFLRLQLYESVFA
jgi:hypothetical protein